MPKSKLSSAYKTAGKAAGAYQASLYDVANIGYQREASSQMAGIKAQDRSRAVGMISEGIDLVGNVARRGERRREERSAAESLGATEQKRTLWEKLGGKERMYEKVGEGGETGTVSGSDIMAEYKLQQQEKAFGRSTTVDETTGKATGTPAEKKTPTLAEEADIVDKGPVETYKEPIGPTQGGSPLGSPEPQEAQMQGPPVPIDIQKQYQPQTSQEEIDKFNKSRSGKKLQKELGQLFGDDFSNYGFQ